MVRSLLLLLTLCAAPAPVRAELPLAVQETPASSTVYVSWYSTGGTGTVIACEDGKSLVLTCAHVVPYAGQTRVCLNGTWYDATFIAAGPQLPGGSYEPDLALLQVDAELPAVQIALEEPPLGSKLRQWAFGGRRTPWFEQPTSKSGEVALRTSSRWTAVYPTMHSTLPSESGDSGAGVFDESGELCAVTWGGPPPGEWIVRSSMVPLRSIRTFLAKHVPRPFARLAARVKANRAARAAVANLPQAQAPAPKELPKTPAATPKAEQPKAGKETPYADIYAMVKRGERLSWTGTPPGMPHGTYECWKVGDRLYMQQTCIGGSCPLPKR